MKNHDEAPLCACGCGARVTINQNTNQYNTYRQGHHFKLAKHREDPKLAQQRMKSEDFKKYRRNGRTWTDESRKQFSKNQTGNKNPMWKGGKHIRDGGYTLILTTDRGYVFEHRLVVEENIGRKLTNKEVVHHRNGNPSDNRIENLELLSNQSDHMIIEWGRDISRRKKRYV